MALLTVPSHFLKYPRHLSQTPEQFRSRSQSAEPPERFRAAGAAEQPGNWNTDILQSPFAMPGINNGARRPRARMFPLAHFAVARTFLCTTVHQRPPGTPSARTRRSDAPRYNPLFPADDDYGMPAAADYEHGQVTRDRLSTGQGLDARAFTPGSVGGAPRGYPDSLRRALERVPACLHFTRWENSLLR